MISDQTLRKLKIALIEKFGAELNNSSSCEQLSIDIFLANGHYVSQSTIMHLYGINNKEGSINPAILGFLSEYAGLSNSKYNIEDKYSKGRDILIFGLAFNYFYGTVF